jgi:hypothetical protein
LKFKISNFQIASDRISASDKAQDNCNKRNYKQNMYHLACGKNKES